MDKSQLMKELKHRMENVVPLPDEPSFATSDETIVRYLKCNDWKLKDAEKALLSTIEYRRQTRPLQIDCKWCHERPGYHSMRQVGHDESGRPVIYANFAQASTHKNSVEDIVTHVTYVIENAKATMDMGVSTWVFVIDCTGMSLSACNPKLGYGMANVLSNHYPERLGLVICVNHNPMFHGVWKALKKVVSPSTSAKVRLVRAPAKIHQVFSTFFPDELSAWLMQEIELNKQKPLPKPQAQFWAAPVSSSVSKLSALIASPKKQAHDPRGCSTYVQNHVIRYMSPGSRASSVVSTVDSGSASSVSDVSSDRSSIGPQHKPHPNVIDALLGAVRSVPSSPAVRGAASANGNTRKAGDDDEDDILYNGFLEDGNLEDDNIDDDDDDDDYLDDIIEAAEKSDLINKLEKLKSH